MATYNLREEVRMVLDTSSLSDPGDVADKVAASIPAKHLRRVLRLTLRDYVRHQMSQDRTNTSDPEGHGKPGTHGSNALGVGTSSAVAAIRDAWRDHLRARYSVDGNWKMLAEMTAADLHAAAAERRDIAARTLHWSSRLDEWAAVVEAHGVATFGALPAAVIASTLGGGA